MCDFCRRGGLNSLLVEELCVGEGSDEEPLKAGRGWLCSWKCLVMRLVASHSLLSSCGSLSDAAASEASSDVSGLWS